MNKQQIMFIEKTGQLATIFIQQGFYLPHIIGAMSNCVGQLRDAFDIEKTPAPLSALLESGAAGQLATIVIQQGFYLPHVIGAASNCVGQFKMEIMQ